MGTGKAGKPVFDRDALIEFKNDIRNSPKLTHKEFIAKFTRWKRVPRSTYSFHAANIRRSIGLKLKHGIKNPNDLNRTINNRTINRLVTPIFRISCKEFNDDPVEGFRCFIQTLTGDRRASFEMVKIELIDESTKKWIPHWEIRES